MVAASRRLPWSIANDSSLWVVEILLVSLLLSWDAKVLGTRFLTAHTLEVDTTGSTAHQQVPRTAADALEVTMQPVAIGATAFLWTFDGSSVRALDDPSSLVLAFTSVIVI
jgi:hypothetical protein